MIELIGNGITGVAVVVGLVVYEQLKLAHARRNGGMAGFTVEDRAALMCQKRSTIETASALERIVVVIDKMDETIVRMDERDKVRIR